MADRQVVVSDEVAGALRDGRGVVALESTIFSTLGLPAPHNRAALDRCKRAIIERGAVPALTAVLDGAWRVGLAAEEEPRILAGTRKMAERDLSVAAAQHWDVGVSTVSATVALAHLAGIRVFGTGGIGGVHRGAEVSGDVSSDLDALANHPVVTVCAGAKAFLDLPRTLEYLETVGVPVLGWQHDWFPAFYLRSSGLRVPHRVASAKEVAAVLRNRVREHTGVLVAAPIPERDELDPDVIESALDRALRACAEQGITGGTVTPFVLAHIEDATRGRSVPANLALAEHNAGIAADIATCLATTAG
jgi:pseudouridine-5'-phosphate glycosidase